MGDTAVGMVQRLKDTAYGRIQGLKISAGQGFACEILAGSSLLSGKQFFVRNRKNILVSSSMYNSHCTRKFTADL